MATQSSRSSKFLLANFAGILSWLGVFGVQLFGDSLNPFVADIIERVDTIFLPLEFLINSKIVLNRFRSNLLGILLGFADVVELEGVAVEEAVLAFHDC